MKKFLILIFVGVSWVFAMPMACAMGRSEVHAQKRSRDDTQFSCLMSPKYIKTCFGRVPSPLIVSSDFVPLLDSGCPRASNGNIPSLLSEPSQRFECLSPTTGLVRKFTNCLRLTPSNLSLDLVAKKICSKASNNIKSIAEDLIEHHYDPIGLMCVIQAQYNTVTCGSFSIKQEDLIKELFNQGASKMSALSFVQKICTDEVRRYREDFVYELPKEFSDDVDKFDPQGDPFAYEYLWSCPQSYSCLLRIIQQIACETFGVDGCYLEPLIMQLQSKYFADACNMMFAGENVGQLFHLFSNIINTRQRVLVEACQFDQETLLSRLSLIDGMVGIMLDCSGFLGVFDDAFVEKLAHFNIVSLRIDGAVHKDVHADVCSYMFPDGLGSLVKLWQLRELILERLMIKDLPNELCDLRYLTTLLLRYNELQALPDAFVRLKELRFLDLSSNKFVKVPQQIFPLERLRMLLLAYNRIGEIPGNVEELAQLRYLDIAQDPVWQKREGSKIRVLPMAIAKLRYLQSVILSDNDLKEMPNEVVCLPSLRCLDVFSNDELALDPETMQNIAGKKYVFKWISRYDSCGNDLERVLRLRKQVFTAFPLLNQPGERDNLLKYIMQSGEGAHRLAFKVVLALVSPRYKCGDVDYVCKAIRDEGRFVDSLKMLLVNPLGAGPVKKTREESGLNDKSPERRQPEARSGILDTAICRRLFF